MNFTQLDLIPSIQRALRDTGYHSATEIQSKSIPSILRGKDVLGCAQTGTGKTAAFAIPVLQKLQRERGHSTIQALVLTPTRELALQIEENFNTYAKHLSTKSLAVFGGVPQARQVAALKGGIDVLIATPGRLMDLMQQGYVDLSGIKILVLDEADRMLDMGFIHDIKRLLKKIPAERQTLLFSATMPKEIRKFADSILRNPIEINVTPVSSAARTIRQSVYFVEKKEKAGLLIGLLKDKSIDRSLVFTSTKYGADKLVKKLHKTGIDAAAIHGNKSQHARQRALEDFKRAKIAVLVATDIASRGIDIDELPLVVNYELPHVPETYVHRIGRTGRAGKDGVAVSFCDMDQREQLDDIQKLIGFKLAVKGNVNSSEQIINL